MVAMRAGRPALFATHDHRLLELVETLHLPNIPVGALNMGIDPYQAYRECLNSFSVKHYKACFGRFIDFLNENRMQPKVSIPQAPTA